MSVNVIDTIKPKNGGSFPVVEAVDVKVSDSQRLDAALAAKANTSDLATLSNAIVNKADKSDISQLRTEISLKAAQSSLDATNVIVAGKADKTDITEVRNALNLKANQSSLDATNVMLSQKADKKDYDNIFAEIDTKANITDVQSADENLQAQINQIEISASAEAVVAPEVAAARVGSDSTTYQTLKERLDTENIVLKGDFEESEKYLLEAGNLYDVNTLTEGKIIHNGTETVSADYGYTDYIHIEAGKTYTISRIMTSAGCLYDMAKNYISNFATPVSTVDNYTYVAESDGYLRINVQMANINSFFVVEGTDTSNISPYGILHKNNLVLGQNQVTGLEARLKDIEYTKLEVGNLYNIETVVDNKYIDNSGNEDDLADYCHTDYIPVKSGVTYQFYKGGLTSQGALYNTSKVFVNAITTQSPTTGVYEYTPEIDGYIRVNFYISYKLNFYVVVKGTDVNNVLPYGTIGRNDILITDNQVDGLKHYLSLTLREGNLYNKETITRGKLLNHGVEVESEYYSYTDYIKVEARHTYVISYLLVSPGDFYDTNKVYVEDIASVPSATSNFEYTPYRDGYIRINIRNADIDSFFMISDTDTSYIVPYGKVGREDLYMPTNISGKTLVCFGDSRTWYDGQPYGVNTKSELVGEICVGYQQTIKRLTQLNVISQGVSGETSAQICERIRSYNFTNVDMVLLEGGVNDFVISSAVIGELAPIGSTFDTTTAYGAWQSAVEYIMTNYPNVKIYIDTPAIAWVGENVFPYSTAKVKKDVAELYNLPCKDLYKEAGINVINRDNFYCDDVLRTTWRLHFNDDGNAKIGELLAAFILNN